MGHPLHPLIATKVRLVDGAQASRVGAEIEGNALTPRSARGSPSGRDLLAEKSCLLASTPRVHYWRLLEERLFVQRRDDSFRHVGIIARSSDISRRSQRLSFLQAATAASKDPNSPTDRPRLVAALHQRSGESYPLRSWYRTTYPRGTPFRSTRVTSSCVTRGCRLVSSERK